MKKFITLLLFFMAATAFSTKAQHLESLLSEKWNGSNWASDWKYAYTYDTNGYLIEGVTQKYDTIAQTWNNQYRYTYTNNTAGEVILLIFEHWDATSLTWVNGAKNDYTYNTAGKLETHVLAHWVGGQWINKSRQKYAYDANNFLISETYEDWVQEHNTWRKYTQTIFTNNSNGNVIESITQAWDTTTSSYNNSSKKVYTYNVAGKEETSVVIFWHPRNNVWQNSQKTVKVYDAKNFLIRDSFFTWSGTNNNWTYGIYQTHSNGQTGLIYQTIGYGWNSSKYVYSFRQTYNYTQPSGLTESEINNKFNVFPNPAQNVLNINISAGKANFQVMNINGQVVRTLNLNSGTNTINIEELPKGMYLLNMISDNSVFTKHFIKD